MIVGTAGHIDHGKSSLVRALTGIDPDRLPEEKRRGITIDLGYAFMDAPEGERIAFVDVPGHERLVHTMVAGATGIDFALLLVAADDGVMPQTREHAAVLTLLGVDHGAIVVTKVDRADAARIAEVRREIAALVSATPLARFPVLDVAATTGFGLDALRTLLSEAARERGARPSHDRAFRLAVDRAFTLPGVGTVVTGSVHAGTVTAGDELLLVPGGTAVRVRSLRAQNRAVDRAVAGERCAAVLSGVSHEAVTRGLWLVAPSIARATDRIDVSLTVWRDVPRAIQSGARFHLHVGATAAMASLAVLEGNAIGPGESRLAQLVLDRPIAVWRGDRLILRDVAARATIAGGSVLDPDGPRRYRRTPDRLAALHALAIADPAARLAAVVTASRWGTDRAKHAAAEGHAAPAPVDCALQAHAGAEDWVLAHAHLATARRAVMDALGAYHAAQPDALGPDAARLRLLASPRLPAPLWDALLRSMRDEGAIVVRGSFVQLAEHGVRLSEVDRRIAQKVAPLLARGAFEGAWVRDLAGDIAEPETIVRVSLARLARQGEVHAVVKDLYYSTETVRRLAGLAREVAGEGGAVAAAAFRDRTGIGRKRAIQILEFFDRVGVLRRVGDLHKVRTEAALFQESEV